jgi:hypothetical protein
LKHGDALSPLLLNFALEYAIMFQVNQDGFKLNDTQLLIYGDDNTGRFIMFFVITNMDNKKTKGPTLMELFRVTGKLEKFF